MAPCGNRRSLPIGLAVLGVILAAGAAAGDEAPPAAPPPLTLCDAVRTALLQNPDILAIRQERGIAAAGVLIARAYPFNPVWEGRFRYAWPVSEGATNAYPVESTVLLEMELRHQGKYRRSAARAVLSRTDWDIAAQELGLAIHVVRAFDTVVYRYKKVQLAQDAIDLNEATAKRLQPLVDAGKLKKADAIILRTEIDDARAQLGLTRTALAAASSDLHAALGVPGVSLVLQGDLNLPPLPDGSAGELAEAARERRPERHSREAAIAEADARLLLERANRFGNLTAGPTYEYDNSSIHNIGVQFALPLPVLNARRADILQRQAEKGRAEADLRAIDARIGLDVEAALLRLKHARAWAETYEDVVRDLEKNLNNFKDLFEAPEQGVTALGILDVQRKVLVARSGQLDAQFELRQAAADLAAALGDPSVVVGPCVPPPAPAAELASPRCAH
jgi:outer membrane protein TolC